MARRAGYRCSKPDCGMLTCGADSTDEGTINIGVAAHITAAASGGPRYDSILSSEQRKHVSNGIWLCQNHAKLIDSDDSHFTIDDLLDWKRLAEARSFTEVVNSIPRSLDDGDLTNNQDVQTVLDLLLEYSKTDLSLFKSALGLPEHSVELSLRLVEDKNTKTFTATNLSSSLETFDQISVIAPPGTGKTTTLLQLADATLNSATSVAVFIPLSEWATGSESFFQSLIKRSSFKEAREQQFDLLAQHGKIVLILDGWNELDEISMKRVRSDVQALKRDFPDLRLVISSRYKNFDIPIDGPVVEVELLTEEQQLDLAKGYSGSDGESLMDHAWRTPGLRELVAIPLYLTALLKSSGGSLPTTKEEILRFFVEELERDRDKFATIDKILQGYHRDYIQALAVEATQNEIVTLSEIQARTITNAVQGRLKEKNQIENLLQPKEILNTLVSAHLLVRSGAEASGVSLQHQQFQEWFASFHVEQLMLLAATGDDEANKELRESILDIHDWEEAILFACERLSRTDQNGINSVAHTILETLGIDPLLSAEMIWRSSDLVWEQIKEDILSFVGKWHAPGHVDRSIYFMISTGRAEFSEYMWPLISDPNDQAHLRALRAGHRFRPSVLGTNIEKQISTLPTEVRKNVISEIASNSGMDGIEVATNLAKADTSPEVKESVIVSLMFRRADRFVKEILKSAPDEVWQSLARRWNSHEFSDPETYARVQKEADKLYNEETDPGKKLSTLLNTDDQGPVSGQEVRELVEKIDFSANRQNNDWLTHRAYELHPKDVVLGLLLLLEQNKQVPFQTGEMLRSSDVVIDDGLLIDRILKNSEEKRTQAIIAGLVGPKTIGRLIDQLLAVGTKIEANNGKYEKSLSDEYHRLMDLISCTKISAFIQSVFERADTENVGDISVLAMLLSRHGISHERGPLILNVSMYKMMTAAIQGWAEILLASSEATRTQFAEIPQAAERLVSPELVPVLLKLLAKELSQRKSALKEYQDSLRNGIQVQNGAHTSWTHQYRRAFVAIGDEQTVDAMKSYLPDPDFGFDAAHVLKEVWKKSQPSVDGPGLFIAWPDFSEVLEVYKMRQSGNGEETHPFTDDIIAVINDLIKSSADEADFKYALKLATVAFSMPYADKEETITTLLMLPVPTVNKRDFLTVLVLSGEKISLEIVLRGIDEFLEDAKTSPWMLHEQDGYRFKEWLSLLPFTEKPTAILEVLDRVEGFNTAPWNLHELLSALGNTPSSEAETVLIELAKSDNRFQSEYDWAAALTKRNTLSAAQYLLDLICGESIKQERGRVSYRNLGRNLSTLMLSHDEFRKDVYKRFPTLADGAAKSTLEYAIAEIADTEVILLLLCDAAAQQKRFQSTMIYSALRNVLIDQEPIGHSGADELYSVPAPELRKALFDLVVTGSAEESQLAIQSLNTIDEIRDDYGQVDVERRHPDIVTGVPWPIIEQKALLQSRLVSETHELPKHVKPGIDFAKAADDIFKFNIPVVPGVLGVNINKAIKHLGDWWKNHKK